MRILTIFALAALTLALSGCNKKGTVAATTAPPPALVAPVIRVEARPYTRSVAITGSLASATKVDVKAQTTGRVVRVSKEEGDRVAAGEAVIWVEDENYKLALRQAETAVEVAEAGVARTRVLDAHNRAELERARNLLRSGGINDRDMKTAEVAEQDSRAQIRLAEAQLEQARAAVAVARKHLSDTVIHAPVTGEVYHKLVNPGAYVEAPTPVFTLVDNSRLELESQVPASKLAPVQPAQRVTFTVSSFPGEPFEGRVIEVSPAVDPLTRSAKVRIRVENRTGRLKHGMFAEGEILTGVASQAIVIPSAAVQRPEGNNGRGLVFLVQNGAAVRRAVEIGEDRGTEVLISSGLQPGDQLIAEQSIELAEGVRIQPAGGGASVPQ